MRPCSIPACLSMCVFDNKAYCKNSPCNESYIHLLYFVYFDPKEDPSLQYNCNACDYSSKSIISVVIQSHKKTNDAILSAKSGISPNSSKIPIQTL